MIKEIEISSYLYILLMVFWFICGITVSQEFINGDFDDRIAKDVVAVEFWADWNKTNECFWLEEISDAKIYRIDLESQTAEDYGIKVLPTLIVFNNGEEVKRFEGNISFQLCPRRTPKKVQKVVDGLMINKF